MTGDEFRARYALLEQATDGGVRSFHAITPTGGVVMVHFIDGGITPGNLALLSALERLEPERRARVREVTAVDGSVAVVTDLLPDFRTLPAWLEAAPAASGESPAAPGERDGGSMDSIDPAPAAALDSREDGAAPTPPPSAEPVSVPADVPPPPAPVAPVAAPSAGAVTPPSAGPTADARPAPGEFTRLFLAADLRGAPAFTQPSASAPPAPAAPAPVAPGPPADTTGRAEPGEFTRLFRAPLGDVGSGPSPGETPPAPPVPKPGEMPSAPAVSGIPVAPRAAEERGEIASPAVPVPPAVSPPPPTSDPARARTDGLPAASPPREDAPPPDAAPLPGAPAAPDGPSGGATGVFSAPAPPLAGEGEAGAQGRGEFSKLFERLDLPAWALSSPDAPPPPPPPAAPAAPRVPAEPEPLRFEPEPEPLPDDDYLDRLYAPPQPGHDAVPHAAEGPGTPLSALPSAFGSPAFGAGAAPFPSAAPPPPAAPAPRPAPGAPARSTTPLLAGLLVTLLLALALILYFVLF